MILRIVWDVVLLITNVVLVIIKEINFGSFLFNIVIVVTLDGYFNFVVYGFFKYRKDAKEENPFNRSQELEGDVIEDQNEDLEVDRNPNVPSLVDSNKQEDNNGISN